MRITFLSPLPNLSGGERVVAIYAEHLMRRGHQVEVICKDRPRAKSLKFWKRSRGGARQRAEEAEVSHYRNYGIPFRVVPGNGVPVAKELPDADLLVGTFWAISRNLANLPARKGVPVYLIQHDEGTMHGPEAEATYTLDTLHVYVSNWIADRVRSRHPHARGVVVPNAIEAGDFDPGPRVRPDVPRVGVMWSRDQKKGADVAEAAVKIARRTIPELEFIGFGTTQPHEALDTPFTRFVERPSATEMADLYASCTAWLFPSRFEGFGLPILEAMAARTPVIGTETGAAPELLPSGGGALVPIDAVKAMADEIVRYATMSADQWTRHSEQAFQATKSYSWGDAADLLERALAEELNRANAQQRVS